MPDSQDNSDPEVQLDPLEEDVQNTGLFHYVISSALEWDDLAAELDAQAGFPQGKTERAIPLSADALVATDGTLLLKAPPWFVARFDPIFPTQISAGTITQVLKEDYDALVPPSEDPSQTGDDDDDCELL